MGHYTQAFGLHMVLAPVDGEGGCGCGLWREHPRVGQSSGMFLEASSWVLSGRLLLDGSDHACELVAQGGHGRVVGAKGRLADRQRPLILFSCTFPARLAVGWTLPSGRPDSRPRWTPWLGRLDGASGHQGGRPPRPTAWPDAFLGSSAVVHPCGWPGRTNDERLSPPWAAVRPSIRVVSSRPGRERPSRPPWCA
jgi:hypothetical protein